MQLWIVLGTTVSYLSIGTVRFLWFFNNCSNYYTLNQINFWFFKNKIRGNWCNFMAEPGRSYAHAALNYKMERERTYFSRRARPLNLTKPQRSIQKVSKSNLTLKYLLTFSFFVVQRGKRV